MEGENKLTFHMLETIKTMALPIAVLALIAGIAVGYGMGKQGGYASGYQTGDAAGYKRAQDEVKKLEAEAGKKAAGEAAKAANPFQAVNPLQGVDANPFEKAKKILNPFE